MELMRIYINLTDTLTVKSENTTINMILFDGYCDSDIFQGTILPGGVDTQKIESDGSGLLSARYILQGTDLEGNPCHLFIENTARIQDGIIDTTHPAIYTDSPSLKWLEKEPLYGRILTEGEQLIIAIYKSE